MKLFAPQTTNSGRLNFEIGDGPRPAIARRRRKLDFVRHSDDAAKESIQFVTRQSFLGLVLVAASEKGICAILLGENAKRLGAELRSRFPKATLILSVRGSNIDRPLLELIQRLPRSSSRMQLTGRLSDS